MSAILTARIKPQERQIPYPSLKGNRSHWPKDLLEAYARYRGPYTIENAETILEEEPVELYNGWLVWQEMTNYNERRILATLQTMLDVSARNLGFGQALPDELECLLSDGTVVKPDASLVSWARANHAVKPVGPRGRPILHGGPELVVEVRSPSNRRAQEKRKRALYFANRVQMIWDVDERRKTIWVYRVTDPDNPTRYSGGDTIDCEPILPGWRRQVDDIFATQASVAAVVGEVAESWRKEGRAEGISEGVARTLREVLPLLVQTRFGSAPPSDLAARLAQCDIAQLQSLQAAVISCNSLEAWVALVPK